MVYEDPDLQRQARSLIPINELEGKADIMSQNTKKGKEKGIHARDCLVIALLDWFKNGK